VKNDLSFLKIHKKLFREKSFPRAPLQKTLYQFMGKRFSGSVLHQISVSSMWGPYPTRKPKNNFSSFLGFQRDFFSKKSLWRGLGQRPNFSLSKNSATAAFSGCGFLIKDYCSIY
jgi:hypothetical protein